MGPLIRVFPDVHSLPPQDLNVLVQQETDFWIFFPVTESLKRGIISKVAHCSIPAHAQGMPLFRNGNIDPVTGKVDIWWLWDGEKSWKVGAITDEQRRLPILGAWNDVMLMKRIEEGWLPERDPR